MRHEARATGHSRVRVAPFPCHLTLVRVPVILDDRPAAVQPEPPASLSKAVSMSTLWIWMSLVVRAVAVHGVEKVPDIVITHVPRDALITVHPANVLAVIWRLLCSGPSQ